MLPSGRRLSRPSCASSSSGMRSGRPWWMSSIRVCTSNSVPPIPEPGAFFSGSGIWHDADSAARAGGPMLLPGYPMPFRLLLILGGLSAFGPLAIDLYLPAFPAMARSFATDTEHVQLSLSVYFVGLAL